MFDTYGNFLTYKKGYWSKAMSLIFLTNGLGVLTIHEFTNGRKRDQWKTLSLKFLTLCIKEDVLNSVKIL